jgi:hypothetical protein
MPIDFSLSFVKKAMLRLSGDQKGWDACSVPGNGLASSESSGRTHKAMLPFDAAVKARVRPSGEIAKNSKALRSGGRIEKR